MAAIGSIALNQDDGYDCGVAMLLTKPATQELSVEWSGCYIHIVPDTPYVVCRVSGATSHLNAYAKGSLLLQEALDLLSMKGRANLAIRDAEDEYIVWWCTGGSRSLAWVSTFTFSHSAGPAEILVQDANGNVVPQQRGTPRHHLGFRFFRLSQISDDLFDAYRNMYLAFESLLSSKYPKGKGKEIDWLRISLTQALSELSLNSLAPPGTSKPVDYILDVIYTGTRLPLFHAKKDHKYFTPAKAADRATVSNALALLTKIVTRMANKWFDVRYMDAWINPEIFQESNRSVFKDAQFVFSDNPQFSLSDSLESASIANGYRFPSEYRESFDNQIRHHVYGELDTRLVTNRSRLHALYLVNDSSPLIAISPDTTLELHGFAELQVLFFLRSRNASAPKYMFSR